jgi:16S rRNA (uracil1498-N3)-methyltransferase
VKHRLYVPPAQLGHGDRVALTEAQARHLETVLRLRASAVLEIFDGEGRRFEAILDRAALRISKELPRPAPRALDVWLAQAVVKGDKLDLVAQKATELGVSRILLVDSRRSVVKLDLSRAKARAERLRRIAQQAARQCGRGDVPKVDGPLSLEGLGAELEPDRRALLLDAEERELRLSQAARGASRLCLVVGPEGGFDPEERDRAAAAGMLRVSLGPLVLRTETAGLAALAVVRHLAGELG